MKVTEDRSVRTRACYLAVGVTVDGDREALGIWWQDTEGSKFWLAVLNDLRQRGVEDVLIACVDGLAGFPDAIEAVFPQTWVQTCIVHQIRSSMRYVSYGDRRKVAAALKPIYRAPNADAARVELETGSFTDAAGRVRRTAGWDCVHVAVDDATRLAYAEVLPDERAGTAVAFLRRALAFYASYGITAERVITDNGSPYRSAIHAIACRALGVRHLRTRPHRPQTNGKAERFIRTMLGGRAYGAIYASSRERTAALDGWLYRYNHHRRHAGIGRQTPTTRLNNLLGTYS